MLVHWAILWEVTFIMFEDVYTEFLFRLLNAIPLIIVLKDAYMDLCAPPRDRKEKLKFHIYYAATPFEKFCTTKNTILIDKKDISKITKEGYYPSCILAFITAVELAINFGGPFILAVYSAIAVDFLNAFVSSVLKKPILRFSSKILAKHNFG